MPKLVLAAGSSFISGNDSDHARISRVCLSANRLARRRIFMSADRGTVAASDQRGHHCGAGPAHRGACSKTGQHHLCSYLCAGARDSRAALAFFCSAVTVGLHGSRSNLRRRSVSHAAASTWPPRGGIPCPVAPRHDDPAIGKVIQSRSFRVGLRICHLPPPPVKIPPHRSSACAAGAATGISAATTAAPAADKTARVRKLVTIIGAPFLRPVSGYCRNWLGRVGVAWSRTRWSGAR